MSLLVTYYEIVTDFPINNKTKPNMLLKMSPTSSSERQRMLVFGNREPVHLMKIFTIYRLHGGTPSVLPTACYEEHLQRASSDHEHETLPRRVLDTFSVK